jgi:uridine kinase
MNIIEAYLKYLSQLVILISGFSGSGKSVIAKNLEKHLNEQMKDKKITFLNLNNYFKKDWNKTVEVGELKVVDWDDPDAIDWDKLNKDIEKNKEDGVIVSGFVFPKDKIEAKVDMHIHLKISKDDLLKNRKDFVVENEDEKTSRIDSIGEEMEKRILNKITFPHYLAGLEKSAITKTIIIEHDKVEQSYNEVFDFIMDFIGQKLKHVKVPLT